MLLKTITVHDTP